MLMNGTRLVGPSIGGLLIALVRRDRVLRAQRAALLAVHRRLSRMRVQRRPERAPTHPLADLAEGWRYAMGIAADPAHALHARARELRDQPYTTLMPAHVGADLRRGSELGGHLHRRRRPGALHLGAHARARKSVAGWAAGSRSRRRAGLGCIGFGISHSVVALGVLMVVRAAACSWRARLQHHPPDRGRRRQAQPRDGYYAMFFVGLAPFGH
jgi:hypothetical protein